MHRPREQPKLPALGGGDGPLGARFQTKEAAAGPEGEVLT